MTDHEKLLATREQLAVTQAALCEAAGFLREAAGICINVGYTPSADHFYTAAERFTCIGEAK